MVGGVDVSQVRSMKQQKLKGNITKTYEAQSTCLKTMRIRKSFYLMFGILQNFLGPVSTFSIGQRFIMQLRKKVWNVGLFCYTQL